MELLNTDKACKSFPVLSGIDDQDRQLIAAIQAGLPLVARPYACIGARIGLSEAAVISRIEALLKRQIIKRLGIVVRHQKLGYRANAMVVWDFPDDMLRIVGPRMKQFKFVTLCYRRPRRLPEWPYNLFCMIHGRDRATVHQALNTMITSCEWQDVPHEVLFSKRCFKQRGARYVRESMSGDHTRSQGTPVVVPGAA